MAILANLLKSLAPRAGFEPATNRLTAARGGGTTGNNASHISGVSTSGPLLSCARRVTSRHMWQHPKTSQSAATVLPRGAGCQPVTDRLVVLPHAATTTDRTCAKTSL